MACLRNASLQSVVPSTDHTWPSERDSDVKCTGADYAAAK